MRAQTNRLARSRAIQLRRNATDCERLLWHRLRGEQLGARFRRQHPFEQFILDLVCLDRRIVIEIDGSHHDVVRDAHRTNLLERAGLRVLRFTNQQVIEEMDAVLETIFAALNDGGGTHPHPNPPLEGEGTSRESA